MKKILVISDGHGDIEKLKRLTQIAGECDAVIFGGDFAAFQKPETGLPFLNELLKLNKNIFAVLGNCDSPEFKIELKNADILIENSVKQFDELYLAGSGGGSKFTGTTPYERTDQELVSDLSQVKTLIEKKGGTLEGLILVCHNPPHGTKTDRVAPLVHVGSKGITEFIKTYKPMLVISGHIHEAFGTDKIGETVLLNPGALIENRYAIVDLDLIEKKYKIDISLKTLGNH